MMFEGISDEDDPDAQPQLGGASDEEEAQTMSRINKTPSQDIFYKGEQYAKGQRVEKSKVSHSQSMN